MNGFLFIRVAPGCWSWSFQRAGLLPHLLLVCWSFSLGLKLQGVQLLFAVGRNLGRQSQAGGFSAARWPAASAAATIAAASGVIFLGSVNVEEPPPAAESPAPPAFPPAAANRCMLSQAQGEASGVFLG